MSTPTDERVSKLPRWARVYIHELERRIDNGMSMDLRPGAVNTLVMTRSEVRNMKMVEASSFRREVLRAQREKP